MFSDFHNIFLWYESEDINQKSLFPKFQLILILRFQVMHDYVCFHSVRPGIQSKDQNQFFTFKVRTFWQSEVKISVLTLWLGALSSLFP